MSDRRPAPPRQLIAADRAPLQAQRFASEPTKATFAAWLIALFMAQTPFYSLVAQMGSSSGTGPSGFVIFQLFISACGVAAILARSGHAWSLARRCGVFALYLFICGLLLNQAVNKHWSEVRFLLFGIPVVAAFGAAAQLSCRQYVRVLLHLLAASMVLSVFAAFLLPATGVNGDVYTGGWRGIYASKNVLGHAAGISFALLLGYGRWGFRSQGGRWIALLCAATCLVFSRSATGILIAFALVLIQWTLTKTRGQSRLVALGAIAFVSLAVIAAGSWVVPHLVGLLGKDTTFTGRTYIWQLASQLARERPFGSGYNFTGSAEMSTRLRAAFDIYGVHNALLDSLINVGWMATALLALAVVAALGGAWRYVVDAEGGVVRDVSTLLMAGCLISGVTESFVVLPNGIMSLLFLLALFGLSRVSDASLGRHSAALGGVWQASARA